jgi:alcohol dehydrogenase (NADP+)
VEGFRQFDCAERYRNEREVAQGLQAGLAVAGIERKDIFLATKLWNTNHRPERVGPAFEASRERLQVEYLDLYLSHTPFAFQPGEEQDPRDQGGNIVYDHSITLLDTWRAMENVVDRGKCRAIGLGDIGLKELEPIYAAARIKPAVIQVESHPYLPETELLEFCKEKGIVLLAFAPLGHGIRPGPLEDPVILAVAKLDPCIAGKLTRCHRYSLHQRSLVKQPLQAPLGLFNSREARGSENEGVPNAKRT